MVLAAIAIAIPIAPAQSSTQAGAADKLVVHEWGHLLSERLVAAGYFEAHADKYARQFVGAGTRIVEVAEGFPRLTPGRVPAGVSRASYEIDLDKAPGVSVSVEQMLRKLGAL